MSKLSRDKGKRGELEFCKALELTTGIRARRTAQVMGKTGQAGDVVSDDLPDVHFEVKRTERLNLRQAMEQAVRDAAANLAAPVPVVAHRMSRQPWLITVRLEDLSEFTYAVDQCLRHLETKPDKLLGATKAEAFDDEGDLA